MLFVVLDAILSENIRSLSVKDDENTRAEYVFDLTCTNCREPHESPVNINRFEKHDMSGSRGEASFVMKCKFCGKDISINIQQFEKFLFNIDNTDAEVIDKIKEQRKKRGLRSIDTKGAAILEIDCRGGEITAFHAGSVTFIAELVSGKKMEFQLEGDENEWYDYDDDGGEELSVVEIKSQIVKGK